MNEGEHIKQVYGHAFSQAAKRHPAPAPRYMLEENAVKERIALRTLELEYDYRRRQLELQKDSIYVDNGHMLNKRMFYVFWLIVAMTAIFVGAAVKITIALWK